MIYVVRGQTGEYSDFTFWDVKAFLREREANDLCIELNDWCEEYKCNEKWKKNFEYRYTPTKGRPNKDLQFQCKYTGVEYLVVSIEF